MATTYGGWLDIWQIMIRHAKPTRGAPDVVNKTDIYAMTYAEHDVFYFPLDATDIPEDSHDGRKLTKLGCHVDDGRWAIHT